MNVFMSGLGLIVSNCFILLYCIALARLTTLGRMTVDEQDSYLSIRINCASNHIVGQYGIWTRSTNLLGITTACSQGLLGQYFHINKGKIRRLVGNLIFAWQKYY